MRFRHFAIVGSCVFAAVLGGARSASADDEALAEAKRQFRAGVNLLDDPDGAKYEDAYHAFKKAYALSQSPKVLGNIGFCAMHLERDGEAIDAYTAYLRDAPDVDERERAQIQRDIATLSSTVAKVRIVARRPAGSAVAFQLLDTRMQTRGSSVENSYALEGASEITVRVRPGRHVFRVRAPDIESSPLETTIEPASNTTQELTFPKPKPSVAPIVVREAPSHTGPIVLGAGALVALGTGIASGILARNAQSEIESSCPNSTCPADYDLGSARTKAKTFGTIADTSFIASGALAGGAVIWWVLTGRKHETGPRTTASALCTGTGCGVFFQRGF